MRQIDDGAGGTIPVGFVHATFEGSLREGMSYTPSGYHAEDEADAVNRYTEELRAQGVETVVAVVHEGFTQQAGSGRNDCRNPSGPVVDDLNARISPEVDAIVTGHWHGIVNCVLEDPAGEPRPVVQGGNHGRLVSEINLFIDPDTGDVLRDRTVSTLHANTQDVEPDAGTLAIADHWEQMAAERGATKVAEVSADLPRSAGDVAESPLANLTADAFLAAARTDVGADLGLVLPGTVLRDVSYAPSSHPADAPGTVLFGEVVVGTVVDSGIGHGVVSGDLTGRDLDALLESQWQQAATGAVTHKHLAVSGNVRYTYDLDRPVGSRIDPGDVRIDGRPLRPNATYRVASTSGAFLQPGTSQFADMTHAAGQERSLFNANDALWHHMADGSPVAPPATDRSQARH
ncbi:bifunctional metallophosphatase/5'-nucleotidase [Georgenia sp. SUBG003]|uniref:bifunctional metallophosphatase/5'-nucleotidase n=1 Tax=Georgenia sp. SUBG003 TaxID=1497974 RepID=UPI0006936ED7